MTTALLPRPPGARVGAKPRPGRRRIGPAPAWLLGALLMGPALARAADTSTEQTVGAIEAVVFVCTPLDARSGKAGLDMLEASTAGRKLDLPAIRKTEAYKSMYNSEANRLLSLPAKERLAACKSAW